VATSTKSKLSKNQAKGLWNSLFCQYYGVIRPHEFSIEKCDTCEQVKPCRRKYLRLLKKAAERYGALGNIPMEVLEGHVKLIGKLITKTNTDSTH